MSFIFEAIFSQWLILVAVAGFLLYRWSMAPFSFYAKRGIPFIKPYPIFGTMGAITLLRESFFDMIVNNYNEFRNNRFFGIFDFTRPVLIIRDPDIIKQITIKDFEHFLDHRPFIAQIQNEPLFGKSLIMLNGQRWRDMRSTLSPAFTGSKMRQMFQLVVECAEKDTEILLKEAKASLEPISTEMKDLFTRFTSDVIATSAFGIKVNSLKDRENEFYQMGKKSTNFSNFKTMYRFILIGVLPKVAAFFKVRLFDEEQSKFYNELVHGTIKHREREGIIRPDMIQLLMEARKGVLKREVSATASSETSEGFATVQEVASEDLRGSQKQVWDDEDVTAQCFLFFVAGFDTSATLLSFAACELMENPDVQKTLIEEVDGVKDQLDGKPLTYDILQKMKYLDMVVSETLRKWPPAMIADRLCIKPYELEDESGRKVKLNKGDGIWIPIIGIHRDPKYHPNPDRFDPERFNDERKHLIQPCTYLPFGSGPRNCIGSRFALMECKAFLYYLLTNFTFEPAPNSTIPLRLAKSAFSVKAENGFNLILKPRF